LEQAPVGIGKPLEELANFEMVAGHGANLGDQRFANIFGHSLLGHLGGEVVTPLGGILVQGALEEVQGVIDLPLELFPAELEDLVLLAAHICGICVSIRTL
jgi:hypothetical protein